MRRSPLQRKKGLSRKATFATTTYGSSRPKKKKQKSVAKLKKELWTWFTLWVKRRDSYKCVTCGAQTEGRNAQGGHYIAKAACGLDYYFSPFNVHCQCGNCNLRLEGNRPVYRNFILTVYGEGILKDLETNYHKPAFWTPEEWQEKIAFYKALALAP